MKPTVSEPDILAPILARALAISSPPESAAILPLHNRRASAITEAAQRQRGLPEHGAPLGLHEPSRTWRHWHFSRNRNATLGRAGDSTNQTWLAVRIEGATQIGDVRSQQPKQRRPLRDILDNAAIGIRQVQRCQVEV